MMTAAAMIMSTNIIMNMTTVMMSAADMTMTMTTEDATAAIRITAI